MVNHIDKVLSDLVLLEDNNKLDNIRISNLPIWNILKYNIRRQYLVEHGICKTLQSAKGKAPFSQSVKGMWKSFYGLSKICITPLKADNLVMGFSRLDYINEEYIDRFIDPVVEITKLKDNYICFEYGRTGSHYRPRRNSKRVLYTDFAYLFSFLWGSFAAYPYCLLHYHELKRLKDSIANVTKLEYSHLYLSRIITEFKCNVAIFTIIMNRVSAKRVFGVSRILFKHVSFVAKRNRIPVYEFQHGITLGPTELYSGNYIPEIDPDYFLLFGESCPRDVFGIPKENTINIGWAFKHYLQGISGENYKANSCLVISEPQISDQIIDATLLLASHFPNIIFHIRRHPQELFTEEQKAKFAHIDNVEDSTNKKNSLLVAMAYDFIIGENSTVLYEGLSLGKKVARLNINGLHPVNRSDDDSFYYIDSVEDFENYLKAPLKNLKEEAYSDFKVDLFNTFLN